MSISTSSLNDSKQPKLTLTILNFYPSNINQLDLTIFIYSSSKTILASNQFKQNNSYCLYEIPFDLKLQFKLYNSKNLIGKGDLMLNKVFLQTNNTTSHNTVTLKLNELGKSLLKKIIFSNQMEIKVNIVIKYTSSIEDLEKSQMKTKKSSILQSSSMKSIKSTSTSRQNINPDRLKYQLSLKIKRNKINFHEKIVNSTEDINIIENYEDSLLKDDIIHDIDYKEYQDPDENYYNSVLKTIKINKKEINHEDEISDIIENCIESLLFFIQNDDCNYKENFSIKEKIFLVLNEIKETNNKLCSYSNNYLKDLKFLASFKSYLHKEIKSIERKTELLSIKNEKLRIKVKKLTKKSKFQEDNYNGPLNFDSLFDNICYNQAAIFNIFNLMVSKIEFENQSVIQFLITFIKKIFLSCQLSTFKTNLTEESLLILNYIFKKFSISMKLNIEDEGIIKEKIEEEANPDDIEPIKDLAFQANN